MSFYLFFVSPLPALLSPAASCDINNLVSALRMDEHLADCVATSCFLSLTLLFFFFILAAEDSSLSWGCEMSVISADLLKSTLFFLSPSDEPPLDVLQPLAAAYWIAAALMWSAVKESAWILSLRAFFIYLFIFFLYKLQFRTVFHIPSRPAFKIRSSQPPLVQAQLNKGHVKINDSQRKHLTVFCSTLRAGNASSSVWYWPVWTCLLSIWMQMASELHDEGCRY